MRTRPRSYANPPMSRLALQPEKKNVDNQGISITTPASNAFSEPVQIGALAIGAGPNARVGRKVHLKSLQIRGVCVPTQVRILVVYDKQYNQGLPAPFAADVMTPNIYSGFRNAGFIDRFITIIDEFVQPFDVTPGSSNTFSFYRKLNLEATYNGDLAANCATGALLVMQADPSTAATIVTFTSRVRFTDV